MDNEDVINLLFRSKITFPIPEISETSDDTTSRAEKDERNKQARQVYNEELRRRKDENTANTTDYK